MKSFKLMSILFLLSLAGCGRVVKWGKDNFYQGIDVEQYSSVVRQYMRSAITYDQLSTQAVFDAIWLSDAVRKTYVDALIARTGKNEEQKAMLLRREIEENNHYITFYVLSLYNVPLKDALSNWSVYLKINDTIYQPLEIKYIDLNPEYQSFFGNFFNRFKKSYQVRFEAKDDDCNPIIGRDAQKLLLCFRSMNKEVVLTWNIDTLHDSIALAEIKKPHIVRTPQGSAA